MSADLASRVDRIRALAKALVDDLDLPGRWRWAGNIQYGGPYLATNGHGQQCLMGFARHRMQNAQPTFRVKTDGWIHLRPAKEVPVYEVAPTATTPDDPRVYRHDVVGFRSPVADYLAAIDAETVLELIAERDRLQATVDNLTALLETAEADDFSGQTAELVHDIHAVLAHRAGQNQEEAA